MMIDLSRMQSWFYPRYVLGTDQLEAIQNRAARFVSGVYNKECSIIAVKKDLNWETLQLRRKVDRQTNFHQAVAGHLAVPVLNVLRPVERDSRHTSTNISYTPIQANKDCYKYTFIPRTLRDWNVLPDTVTNIKNKKAFKMAVNRHLQQLLPIEEETN